MKKASKALSLLLSLVMVLGIVAAVPVTAFASEKAADGFTTMTLVSSKESVLAPGVTQYINSVYAADGKLIKYYYAVADLSNSNVGIHTSYKDAQCDVAGMAKMTDQAASLEALHSDPEDADHYIANYAVVAGVNADGYNTGSGAPSGVHIMEGYNGIFKGAPGASKDPWFAIFEDGTALCGSTLAEWNDAVAAHGAAQEAIGGFQLVMQNGVEIPFGSTAAGSSYLDTGRYPRSFIGVTADNKVVMMAVDGNGAGGSAGTNYAESVEILKQAGCTEILCLDGGGSATYISRPEGSDDVAVTNVPSDGSERAVSNGIVIYSTTPPSNVFDRATLTAEHSYVTPGSSVQVDAVGISPAGTAAEIPENYEYTATLGTITKDGVFTSNGETGDAEISMVVDGKVVGTETIHVVNPDSLTFKRSSMLVPLGQTVELEVIARYGVNTVVLKNGDVQFSLADSSIGTISGNKFTAGNTVKETTVTAALAADSSISHTIALKLGKGSEVLMDFEAGSDETDLSNWGLADQANGNHIHSTLSIVTPETGMVHSGDQALAFNYKMDEGIHGTEFWAGNGLQWLGESIELKNATGLGFWLYVPEDAVQLGMFVNLFTHGENGQMNGRVLDESSEYTDADPGYSGWRYIHMPLSGGTYYIEDNADKVGQSFNGSQFKYKANKFIGFYAVNIDAWKEDLTNFAGDFTYYIDDITVDYSDAVEDRELPVFSDMTYAVSGMSDAAVLNGQTVDSQFVSFAAKVEDESTKDNASGLQASTAVVYIDGIEVDCQFDGSIISVDDAELTNGVHTIRMGICDQMGNYAETRGQINVQANTVSKTIYVRPHDAEQEYMLNDSVYWIDVVADTVESVEKVEVVLDLDSMNNWELDYAEVLSGFEMDWKFATANDKAENIVTLTFTRNGYVSEEGTAVLASLPVRVWEYTASDDHKHANAVEAWKCNYVCAPALSVDVDTEMGVVTYLDGSEHSFSSADIRTYCVSYTYGVYLKDHASEYYSSHSFHLHDAAAVADKAATCTTAGYTGRTYCDVCKSVVNWGTIIPATGHSFAVTDGVLKCACGELFNGEYTDGKTYVDGVVLSGWTEENTYYVDGVKLTGIQLIDGFYYNFGEDGVCAGQTKYTGKFHNEAAGGYSYAINGELQYGWYLCDGIWNYYKQLTKLAVAGEYTFVGGACAGITYVFDDEGNLTTGVWHTYEDGNTRYFYGPNYYYWQNNMLQEIDGKTYCFDGDGYLYRGRQMLRIGAFASRVLYDFDEVTGELIKTYDTETGVYRVDNENLCYLKNGVVQNSLGMITVDGAQYYVRGNGLLAVGKFYIGAGYGGCGHLAPGYYDFGEDGKFVGPWVDTSKNGIVADGDGKLHYYVNGVEQKALGMLTVDGAQYYVRGNGLLATGKYYIGAGYAGCGHLTPGYYVFDEDGKFVGPWVDTSMNGILLGDDGKLHYYVNGAMQKGLGMITVDGAQYYVRGNGLLATGKYYIGAGYAGCGHLTPGYYEFGEDSKFIGVWVDTSMNGILPGDDGELHYYVNGAMQKGLGMITVDGAQYYVRGNGLLATGKYYIGAGYAGCGHLTPGYYVFDENGKFVGPWVDTSMNGILPGNDGELHYYVNGAMQKGLGMITVDDAQYYVRGNGLLAVGKYYIGAGYAGCGHLTPGYYDFGTDGKFVGPWIDTSMNGIQIGEDGKLHYYVDGIMQSGLGMITIDGAQYYVRGNGLIAVGKYYIGAGYAGCGHLTPGFYDFGTDGAFVGPWSE